MRKTENIVTAERFEKPLQGLSSYSPQALNNSPMHENKPIRDVSKRVVSLDSSPYVYKNEVEARHDPSSRSLSATHLMNPLEFNKVMDDIAHPLSSLRSCSEFGINLATRKRRRRGSRPQPSLWSRISFWSRQRTSETDSEEEDIIIDDGQPSEARSSLPAGSCLEVEFVCTGKAPDPPKTKPKTTLRQPSRHNQKTSFKHEIQVALDVVFGVGLPKQSAPKEIELKNLKDPAVIAQLAIHREPTIYHDFRPFRDSLTFERRLSVDSQHSSHASSDVDSIEAISPFAFIDPSSWYDVARHHVLTARHQVMGMMAPGDADFLAAIQLAPFSAGIYLRGVLISGFSNLFFHSYNIMFMPEVHHPLTSEQTSFYSAFYLILWLQFALNVIQTPLRIGVHFQCWEASRAADTEAASGILSDMIRSTMWWANRLVGWLVDGLAVASMVGGEAYLRTQDVTHADTLSPVIIALCTTNMLSFLIRGLVSLVFFMSHDSSRLHELHRRGLTSWDLEKMATFVYAHTEEVNNTDCSICLTPFELGEMLISLPCDKRHSFHASCIRQWLQRQNSCPLCQKTV